MSLTITGNRAKIFGGQSADKCGNDAYHVYTDNCQ